VQHEAPRSQSHFVADLACWVDWPLRSSFVGNDRICSSHRFGFTATRRFGLRLAPKCTDRFRNPELKGAHVDRQRRGLLASQHP
jgi:hypothetical protein